MRDVIFVLLVVGFFALATAYVRGCAAVVSPDVDEARPLSGAGNDDRSETVA
jgi:hypothetical protein